MAEHLSPTIQNKQKTEGASPFPTNKTINKNILTYILRRRQ